MDLDRNTYIIFIDTVANSIVIGITIMGLQYLFAGKVPDYMISMFTLFYWAINLIATPIWSMASDHTGKRKIFIIISLGFTGLVTMMFAYVSIYIEAVILQILLALFASAYGPIALALLTWGYPKDELGKRSSLFNLSRSTGFLISGYLAALVIYFLGLREIFIVTALITFFGMFVSLFIIDRGNSNGKLTARALFKLPGKDFIKNYNAHYVFIATALRHAMIMGLNSIIFLYYVKQNVDIALLSALSSFNTLVQVITMMPLGHLADKIGRKPLYSAGMLLSSLIPIWFIFARDPVSIGLSFAYIGISFSILISGLTPFFKDIAPEGREGESLSFLQTSRAIGSIIGPIVVSLAIYLFDYTIMFVSLSLLSFIGFLISLKGKETL